jgi:FemAB-related protein (PEP-CTERM system-associated)
MPQVLIGGKEYLDDFYKVYMRNMRDLGSPAHSKLLVKNILDSFPENSWIIVLRLNNKPVSAGLLLGHGNTMEIPLASTICEVNPLSMNMLLYWEALKLAIRNGYRAFDFGRSSKDAGTYRFKQQWGAQPKQLYWHYWLPENVELPRLNPDNPKYALAISIWKRIPIFITKWLGPLIVRNLP